MANGHAPKFYDLHQSESAHICTHICANMRIICIIPHFPHPHGHPYSKALDLANFLHRLNWCLLISTFIVCVNGLFASGCVQYSVSVKKKKPQAVPSPQQQQQEQQWFPSSSSISGSSSRSSGFAAARNLCICPQTI